MATKVLERDMSKERLKKKKTILAKKKLKTCALLPFLMLLLIFQRILCHFLESCYPQLISRKRSGWWTFSRVDESSPEDLRVLAELRSPEAGASPRNKCFLPVSFLLLQGMLVGRPDLGCPFRMVGPLERRGSPLAVSSESDAVFGKVHGKRRMTVCLGRLLPCSVTLHLTRIHLCTRFLTIYN